MSFWELFLKTIENSCNDSNVVGTNLMGPHGISEQNLFL